MVQVLAARQPNPTFGQKLNLGVGRGLESASSMLKGHQEKEAIRKAFGDEIANLPPEMQKIFAQEQFKSQFAPQGPKPLTELQQSQKALADERLKALQGQQQLFEKIRGNEPNQSPMEGKEQYEKEGQDFLSSLPEEDLNQLSAFAGQPGEMGIIGNMAKEQKEKRKEDEKLSRDEFQQERTYHTQFSKPLEEKNTLLRNNLPKQEQALNFARQAIESGETGAFTLNHLAEIFNADSLRTAKGAQLILASKEQLLPTLGRISAKAQNQYMERRLASMIPQIGQRDEANLSMQEMLEGEAFLDRAYLEEFDRVSEEDQNKYGFVKKDIDKRVHNNLKSVENEIANRTNYRLREIEEQEKGLSKLKSKVGKNVIKGTPLTLQMAKLYKEKFGNNALDVAKKNGYTIPTIEEYKIIQQRPQEFREEISQ
jgi:hypothetical protein